jgi:IPT/TIG domain
MNRWLQHVSLWLTIVLTAILPGCVGSGQTPVLSISGPSAIAIDQGQLVNFSIDLQHGHGEGVTWTCSGPASTSTSLTNQTSTSVTFNANGSTGTATVTATSVKDTSVSASVSINVNAPPAVTTTQAQLKAAPAADGQKYSFTFSASGGSGTLTWTATVLPADGLSLSSAGVLSGTPTMAGTISFTLTVTDSSAAGPKSANSPPLTLNVGLGSVPNIMSLSPTSGPVGTSVTIAGVNFGATQGTSTVTFNGTVATPTSWSTTSIVAPVPSAATAGNVIVTVGGVASNGVGFTVTAALSACGGGGSEALLSGHYAMLLQGFDNTQPIGIGGVFEADGSGHITLGTEDINSAGNLGLFISLGIDPAKSSYSVGSDQRGCLTIVTEAGTGTPSASSPITLSFRFSLGSVTSGVASSGQLIQFDSTGPNGINTAGYLERQDTSAFSNSAIKGTYAFGASAREVGLGEFGIAGVFISDGNGNITGGVADYNTDNGGNLDGASGATDFPAGPLTVKAGGNYGIGTSLGRGSVNFFLSDGTGVGAAVYVISATELLMLMEYQQSSHSPLFVGRVLLQSKSSFGNGDLNAAAVYYASGLGSAGTRAELDIVTLGGSGTFSITGNQDDSGVLTSGSSSSGIYTVSSNGRVLLSGIGKHNSVLYLTAPNKGFALDASAHCESGFLAPQSGEPFTNALADSPPPYAFGTIQPGDTHVEDSSGVYNFDGSGNLTGTSDDNSTGNGGPVNPDQSINYTYTIDSTGTGIMPAGCSFTAGTCDYIFMVISPPSGSSPFGQVVLIDADSSNTYPALITAEQ